MSRTAPQVRVMLAGLVVGGALVGGAVLAEEGTEQPVKTPAESSGPTTSVAPVTSDSVAPGTAASTDAATAASAPEQIAAQPSAPPIPPPPPAPDPEVLRKQAMTLNLRDQVRKELDGTTWPIQLKRTDGSGEMVTDTVTFTGPKIGSERLSADGYPTTNYSARFEDNGLAVWETMQMKPEGGTAFWRGEVRGSKMEGMLTEQAADGSAAQYQFSGTEAGGKAIAVDVKAAEAAAAAKPSSGSAGSSSSKPAQAQAAKADKPDTEKKRGWFR